MLLNFRTDEQDIKVDVRRQDGRWLLNIEGQKIPLVADQDRTGCWLVDTHQGRRRLWVAARGDERLVFCDGRVHTFRLPDPEHEDADTGTSGGPNLVAGMPGKVVRVLAAPGEQVKAGQKLVIMESMKMETELEAAIDGEIQNIHVEEGQIVAQGDILVTITPGE